MQTLTIDFVYWTRGAHGLYRAPVVGGHSDITAFSRWSGTEWVKDMDHLGDLLDGDTRFVEVTVAEAAARFPTAVDTHVG
jgi:hypothetical protein